MFSSRRFRKIWLAASCVLGAVILIMTSKTTTRASGSSIPICAKAQILNVTLWTTNTPDRKPSGGTIDVFSVKVRNPSKETCTVFPLISYKNGQPNFLPTIIAASDGYRQLQRNAVVWKLVQPRYNVKTVFFVAKSDAAEKYCAGEEGHGRKCSH